MNSKKLEISVRVDGMQPKELQLVVFSVKGELTFDYELQQFSFPTDFKNYCRETGAIWAIFHEEEIKAAIEKYIGKSL